MLGFADLSEDIESVSTWFPEGPMILTQHRLPTTVQRHLIAKELAHLTLHRHVHQSNFHERELRKLMDTQASLFAMTFLAPIEGLELPRRLDLALLIELERRWGIPAEVLIKRLESARRISRGGALRFHERLHARKRQYKHSDSVGNDHPDAESPSVLLRAAHRLTNTRLNSWQDAFHRTGLPSWFLERLAGLQGALLGCDNTLTFGELQTTRKGGISA